MADEIQLTGIGGTVKFKVRPKITESVSAAYIEQGLDGREGIAAYTITDNRKYNITATFVSRTKEEAFETYSSVNLLKGWLYPEHAEESSKPSVVVFKGYDLQFDSIPTYIMSCNITYDDSVDYIHNTLAWVPIIQTVSLTLIETHTAPEAKGFSLNEFKLGVMPGY